MHKTALKLTPAHVLFLDLAGGLMKDSDLTKKPMNFVHEHLYFFVLFLAFVLFIFRQRFVRVAALPVHVAL